MALTKLIFVGLISMVFSQGADYRRVCYYTNWSQYRPAPGKFTPDDIEPSHCTHINYAFAVLTGSNDALKPFEWNDDDTPWSKGMYSGVMKAKSSNPSVKVSLAVGGWNFGSTPFSEMVNDLGKRSRFVSSAVTFLRKRNFDGLDLDWEYPGARGGKPEDKDAFTALVKELHDAFEAEARSSGKERLLLTSAIPAGKSNIDGGFDAPAIESYFDFLNLMTYDLHGAWEEVTGINAPLYATRGASLNDSQLSMEFAANYWVSLIPTARQAAFKKKLTLGMPLYGRSFTLKDHRVNGVGAPNIGPGDEGTYTREAGFYSYYEICEMVNQGGVVNWDEAQQVPYLVYGDQWVGFDNERSLRQKTRWMKENGFGGVMFWAIDLDSFNGQCNGQNWPLMTAVLDELKASTLLVSVDEALVQNQMGITGGSSRSTTAPPTRPTVASTTAPPTRPTVASTTVTSRPTVASTTAPPTRPTVASTTALPTRPTVASTTAPPTRPTVASTTGTSRPTVASTTAPPTRPTVASTTALPTRPTVASTTALPTRPTVAPSTKQSTVMQPSSMQPSSMHPSSMQPSRPHTMNSAWLPSTGRPRSTASPTVSTQRSTVLPAMTSTALPGSTCMCTCPSMIPGQTTVQRLTVPFTARPTAQPSTAAPSTAPQPPKHVCTGRVGIVADTKKCTFFHLCAQGGRDSIQQCPEGTYFDTQLQVCNYKASVQGCDRHGNRTSR